MKSELQLLLPAVEGTRVSVQVKIRRGAVSAGWCFSMQQGGAGAC